jgi:hypothetical protein
MVTPLLHLQQISSKARLQEPAAGAPLTKCFWQSLSPIRTSFIHHPAACSGPARVANIRSERGDFGIAIIRNKVSARSENDPKLSFAVIDWNVAEGWKADIRSRFLRELSDCFGYAGIAARQSLMLQ